MRQEPEQRAEPEEVAAGAEGRTLGQVRFNVLLRDATACACALDLRKIDVGSRAILRPAATVEPSGSRRSWYWLAALLNRFGTLLNGIGDLPGRDPPVRGALRFRLGREASLCRAQGMEQGR